MAQDTQVANDQQVSALLAQARQLELDARPGEAIAFYREWLLRNPNGPGAFLIWYEFGRLLQITRAFVQAENAFRAALEQRPDLIQAMIALGVALESQGRIDDAITTWRAALQPDALRVDLFNNIGRLLDANFRFEPAEEALLQSLRTRGEQPEVIATLLQLRQRMCRWPVLSADLGVPLTQQEACIGPLTALAMIDDPARTLAAARQFLRLKSFDQAYPALREQYAFYAERPRLRIGFLSADFRLHATSIFFAPLIEGLDKSQFETYAFDLTTVNDPFGTMRERLLRAVDHVVPLQTLTDDAAARAIQATEIDVLIDMSGLTSGARPAIVAQRPAPLQIAWLGFLGSCGIPTVDYIMTAPGLFPEEHHEGYSERPLYLPSVYLTVDANAPAIAAAKRSDYHLPEQAMVYCALMNSYKINPGIFNRWMDILKGVPGSVLWLVEENPTARRNLESHAASAGIDPSRLVFTQRIHPSLYRACLRLADLFLDTSPYGNGATAHDAVHADLPILTRPGNTMMSRLSAHFMHWVGLDDFVVDSWDRYTAYAIELGHDRSRIDHYRTVMRDARAGNPLFDSTRFARDFGDTVLAAVANHRQTQTAKTDAEDRSEGHSMTRADVRLEGHSVAVAKVDSETEPGIESDSDAGNEGGQVVRAPMRFQPRTGRASS